MAFLRIVPLLVALAFGSTTALHAATPREEQVGELLGVLGVDELIGETAQNARAWARAYAADAALSAEQAAQLEKQAAEQRAVTALRERVIADIVERCDEQQLGNALVRLADSPAAALRSAAAFPKNAEERADFDNYTERMKSDPPLPARVAAIDALLDASRVLEQLMLINRANEEAVESLLQSGFTVTQPDFGEAAEHVRQQAAAAQAELLRSRSRDLYIYALRFTEQADIDALSSALDDTTVRWFVDLCVRALERALRDTTLRPPDPARST